MYRVRRCSLKISKLDFQECSCICVVCIISFSVDWTHDTRTVPKRVHCHCRCTKSGQVWRTFETLHQSNRMTQTAGPRRARHSLVSKKRSNEQRSTRWSCVAACSDPVPSERSNSKEREDSSMVSAGREIGWPYGQNLTVMNSILAGIKSPIDRNKNGIPKLKSWK
jgi:hypothetical protein